MKVSTICAAILVASLLHQAHGETNDVAKPPASDRLIVHEWGTFTELQDEQGISLQGINVDDEPVPDFVHGFGGSVLTVPQGRHLLMKGLPRRFPRVVMRLETPVIYFYPPAGTTKPIEVDVEVAFQGGWLSEYYPNAHLTAPGLKQMNLNPGTVGRLRWENLRIGTNAAGPETDEAVWLTPRLTDAAHVTTSGGESESYLFYRGVGNFAGPVRVRTDRLSKQLTIQTDLDSAEEYHFPAAWLVHVRADGALAFRRLEGFTASESDLEPHLVTSSEFSDEDFAPGYLAVLKGEMHDVLMKQGLYDKEATAMLNTWNRAYFQSPGLRLFYVLPQALVDQRMPLKVNVDADIARAMVARVELISPEQRKLIEQLKRGPVSSLEWIRGIPKSPARDRFFAGRSDFGDLGVEIPRDYQRYLDLGRFRNALLCTEHRLRPTAELNQFMATYRLQSPFARAAAKAEQKQPRKATGKVAAAQN